MGIFRPAALPPEEADALVRARLQWILESCEPAEVWLFGSAAQGKMTEASDIDLALVFETEEELAACRRRLYNTERPDSWPQDLAFFTREDLYRRAAIGGLPMLVVQEGQLLHRRGTQ